MRRALHFPSTQAPQAADHQRARQQRHHHDRGHRVHKRMDQVRVLGTSQREDFRNAHDLLRLALKKSYQIRLSSSKSEEGRLRNWQRNAVDDKQAYYVCAVHKQNLTSSRSV